LRAAKENPSRRHGLPRRRSLHPQPLRPRLLLPAPVRSTHGREGHHQFEFGSSPPNHLLPPPRRLRRGPPRGYRPLFCQYVLYSVLGRAAESESMLERCQAIAGDKLSANLTMPISATK
uniref:Uncharacterized protein n=1 Tax=Aegilops tauschii subsp. strangulata TaxID=200361 RepID=A0A453PAC6_AEGTS